MQLNFDSENGGAKDVAWADRDRWNTGDVVNFEVLSADLLEVVKDGASRLRATFMLRVLNGPNEGKQTQKDVWDPIANKGSQGYLKHLLGAMSVSQAKLNGGNVPLAMAEAVGAKYHGTCEKTNGGKWVNWDKLTPLA